MYIDNFLLIYKKNGYLPFDTIMKILFSISIFLVNKNIKSVYDNLADY